MAINIDALMAQIEAGQTQANNAGMQRYQSLLNAVSGTKNAVLGSYANAGNALSTAGNNAVREVRDSRTRGLANNDQAMISRGLGNTTVRAAGRRGIISDSNKAMADIQERIGGQKAGLQTQLAGAQMGLGQFEGDAILSRQDIGPPIDLYAQLIQSLMANGGGGGGGGKSYNFVGAVPPPSAPAYGGYETPYQSPGVQTFTNGQPSQKVIRQAGTTPPKPKMSIPQYPAYQSPSVQTFTR